MTYRGWVCGVGLAAVILAPAIGAAQTAGKTAAPQAAQKVDDSTLTTRVEARLKQDPSLKKEKIDVAVADGVVTLTGAVHSRTHSARAERLAKVRGVTRVDNKLEVETAATTGEKVDRTMDKAADKSDKTMDKAEDKAKRAGAGAPPCCAPPSRPWWAPTFSIPALRPCARSSSRSSGPRWNTS